MYVHVGMAESWFFLSTENYNYSRLSESLINIQSLNSSHLSVFDHWILNQKYPCHCILWILPHLYMKNRKSTMRNQTHCFTHVHFCINTLVYCVLFTTTCNTYRLYTIQTAPKLYFIDYFWSCKCMSIYLGSF